MGEKWIWIVAIVVFLLDISANLTKSLSVGLNRKVHIVFSVIGVALCLLMLFG